MTIGTNISIYKGKFPDSNKNEFINNNTTNEQNQVGLIHIKFQGYQITVRPLKTTINLSIDIQYYISTTALEVLDNILNRLRDNIL